MSDIYLHFLPGYSVYNAYSSSTSDEPFSFKARSAALAGATTGLHFLFATHHAQRIMNFTRSAPAPLVSRWRNIATVAGFVASVPGAVITLGLSAVLLGEVLEQTYGEHSRITEMKQMWNPTSPRAQEKIALYSQ